MSAFKLTASVAQGRTAEGMRISGGCSHPADFDVERYYRHSPPMCIGEGTDEMQRIITARQLAERNPA